MRRKKKKIRSIDNCYQTINLETDNSPRQKHDHGTVLAGIIEYSRFNLFIMGWCDIHYRCNYSDCLPLQMLFETWWIEIYQARSNTFNDLHWQSFSYDHPRTHQTSSWSRKNSLCYAWYSRWTSVFSSENSLSTTRIHARRLYGRDNNNKSCSNVDSTSSQPSTAIGETNDGYSNSWSTDTISSGCDCSGSIDALHTIFSREEILIRTKN